MLVFQQLILISDSYFVLVIWMASDISYKITLSNNKTEKQAIDFLQSVDKRFLLPSKEGRKQIVEALQMEKDSVEHLTFLYFLDIQTMNVKSLLLTLKILL